MQSKTFKVRAFDVEEVDKNGTVVHSEELFSQALGVINKLPIEERSCSDIDCRLEHYEQRETYILLNFVKLRFHGPMRVSTSEPVSPLVMGDDEFFGYETAMLYDPQQKIALVESSQLGVSSAHITRYISRISNLKRHYRLTLRVDQEAAARARQMNTIRSVSMRVNLGPIDANEVQKKIGILDVANNMGVSCVDITFSANLSKRKESLKNVLKHLFSLSDKDSVEKMAVRGKANDSEPLELIDLIQHHPSLQRTITFPDRDRHLSHRTRWDSLLVIRRDISDEKTN